MSKEKSKIKKSKTKKCCSAINMRKRIAMGLKKK